MISEIHFKTGATSQGPPIHLSNAPITIFVGPNNAGKSKALNEIYEVTSHGSNTNHLPQRRIIEQVYYSPLTQEEAECELALIEAPYNPVRRNGITAIQNVANNTEVNRAQLLTDFQNPNSQFAESYSAYTRLFTSRLDGRGRLNIPVDLPIGDLKNYPANYLAKLFLNNDLRNKVRRIVFDAFGKYLIIDPTQGGQLSIRLSNTPPQNEEQERGLTDAAIAFQASATHINEASDGVRAFIGIITTLLAGDPRIILLDEPEAFLHPGLAALLGQEINNLLIGSKKRVFVATHSASFLMGCIQSGSPVNIVRLTHKDGVGTTRVLDSGKLLHLMRNPMLRSTGVLNGLFYEAVIVTEADADRAFYQEINERLLRSNDERGIANCLFINAQNKQTVWDIVQPLRDLGIPAVGIVDLDMVKDGGGEFGKILASASVPSLQHQAMGATRSTIKNALNTETPDWKRSGGINVLSASDQQAANRYFEDFEDYGVFVVRTGELESWLGYLGVPTNKYQWLQRMFERLGEDPQHPDFVRPLQGDVWDFMGRIRKWVDNPLRFGIPS